MDDELETTCREQGSVPALKRPTYTHAAMIDTLIAEPMISQRELAAKFGFTEGWVSRILRSDALQEMLAARKAELVDPIVIQSIEQNLEALAQRSAQVLLEKMDLPAVSGDLAVKVLEVSSRALGYGAQKTGVNIQQNFVVAMPQKSVDGESWIGEHSPRAALGQG
jgi:hypothetical protein